MRQVRVIVALAAAAGLAAGVAHAHPAAHAAGSCANLRAPSTLRAQLAAAFHTAHRGAKITFVGPLKGQTYYGRCGSTRWAIATFTTRGGDATDQPETFRRLSGGTWHDRGDDGAICAVPHSLTALWSQRALQSAICG